MPQLGRNGTRSAALLSGDALIVLAALCAVRVAVPLVALAASGMKLPGLPRYDYVATTGDGSGFYAATREFLASWGRLPVVVLIALAVAVAVGAAAAAWAWRGDKVPRQWLVVVSALAFACTVAVAVTRMHPPGAAVFGWPLLWSLPMLPYRALGAPLDPDIAFAFGLTLSLLANVTTTIAIAFAGFYATGRRRIAIAAAALYALWPLLVGIVGGSRAWGNGTWTVDAGLAMYTEPVSTALVTVALALLLSPRLTPLRCALAGVTLGLATTVKLTNALAAGLVLVLLLAARVDRDRVLPYLAGLLAFAPLVAAYWPKGYQAHFDNPNSWPRDPFSADYVVRSWTESLLFRPQVLLVLVPLALIGFVALRRPWRQLVLAAWILGNALFYSFYRVTPEHPRFLFASLPAVFLLWTLGVATAATVVRAQVRRGRYTIQSPTSTRR